MSRWLMKRKQPFSDIGIRRLKCIRCGKAAFFQWQICADGNNFRLLCITCDVELNAIVLAFMGDPFAEMKI